MSEKRTVTVSITVNLGNYENLRLEVSDTAETKEEADALRYFLSDILDGYANNNATAKEALDKYKERILADAAPEETETAEPSSLPAAEPEPVREEPVSVPETKPKETAEFTCAKCGAPVTKLQRDVSLLFNHKILCKDCMK